MQDIFAPSNFRNSELTAASASSVECLRAQLREQRSRYEARIADLEMRLTKAAAAASKAMPAAPTKAKVKIPKGFTEITRSKLTRQHLSSYPSS